MFPPAIPRKAKYRRGVSVDCRQLRTGVERAFGVLPVTHPAKAPYSISSRRQRVCAAALSSGSAPDCRFSNRDIRNITSYNEIDLELPGKQPCAYYCITSDQDSTFDFLSSLFLSFVFIRLVRYADEQCPGGELPVPVHVLGEELCACGVIPDLSRKFRSFVPETCPCHVCSRT